MITYKDMTFCAQKECPRTYCVRHPSKVIWDEVPEWMGVSWSDFCGKYPHCPSGLEPVDFKEGLPKNEVD